MQKEITHLKLGINAGIQSVTTLLKEKPFQLKDHIKVNDLDDPDDTIYIVENLQETLNLLLDARKRLMLLGLYEIKNATPKAEMEE